MIEKILRELDAAAGVIKGAKVGASLDKAFQASKTADNFLRRNKYPLLGLAGVGLAGYGIHSLLQADRRDAYLSASVLGKRGVGLDRVLFDETEELDAHTRSILASGELYHKAIQQNFGITSGSRSEVKVIDDVLGVKGFIDVLLPGNVPLEIKTISSKGLDDLNKPLDAHRSQINFYLHARKSNFGYLMYLDAQNISRTKVFKVGYEPGRLMADVEEARSKILLNPDRASTKSIKWLTDTYSTSPSFFNGIRQSSGYASSWDAMKESQDFPGGRLNSIVQASRYMSLRTGVPLKPTLGLTTRLHETAIGHKARSSTRKVAGTRHPNASRMYR